jgi:hypothetical protein
MLSIFNSYGLPGPLGDLHETAEIFCCSFDLQGLKVFSFSW